MKIRVGYGLGTRTLTNTQESFGSFVDDLERLEFDSLWVSERISGDAPDPAEHPADRSDNVPNLFDLHPDQITLA